MMDRRGMALALVLVMAPLAAPAEEVVTEAGRLRIADGYVLVAGPAPRSAAAYFTITNEGEAPDRLVAVEGDAAARLELHAHVLENDVARMERIEGGIEIPVGATVALERGGLHVMLMGIDGPPASPVEMTLVFERAGRIPVALPVGAPGEAGHGAHGH